MLRVARIFVKAPRSCLAGCHPLGQVQSRLYGEVRSRKGKSLSGWFSRRGTRAGYPCSDLTKLREIGVDLTLQERLDQMFRDDNEVRKKRTNIGFAPAVLETAASKRSKMLELRRHQRANPELEKAARLNKLEVDIDQVRSDHSSSGALFKDIFEAAELYGIFEDLFGADMFFNPCVSLSIRYDLQDGNVIPVHRGNVIKPWEARSVPEISFEDKRDEEKSLWTLVMSNPDGHFQQDEAEYLHWMVTNISGDDLTGGETICPYLPPFPPFGTGFHRLVFVLYKQSSAVDLSRFKQPPIEEEVSLESRTFHTKAFFDAFRDVMKPAGLAFFQSDYDSSLHHFYHDVLNMKEPKYEYHFIPPYVKPWNTWFKDHGGNKSFNLFLDRFRDPKEIQEEVLKKRLKTFDSFEGDLDSKVKYPNAYSPHAGDRKAEAVHSSWRLREIERERLRKGYYRDLDWFEPRRDPVNS